uniref:Multiple C2 and transmembrane domain containing 1 n=1 Tax=Hucho hucho TaxID=62062 RepID=A0A4W5MGZ0_9TELE
MEKSEENDDEASSSSSHQNTMWKQFQARAKPILSPKLSARNPDEKKEKGSLWMFRKKKKHPVLDRVISSSQPDLFSEPVGLDLQESPLCGKVDPSTSHSSRQAVEETMQTDTQRDVGCSGIPKPTLVQLVQSHHKSSSLGSSCLERLVADPSASGSDSDVGEKEPQQDKADLQGSRLTIISTEAAKINYYAGVKQHLHHQRKVPLANNQRQ